MASGLLTTQDSTRNVVRGKILSGDHVNAISILTTHLAANAGDAESWNMLGIALFQSGRLTKSHEAFRSSIEKSPEVERYWSDFVVALSRSPESVGEFLSVARESLNRFPKNETVWIALVEHFRQQRDLVAVESLLQQALQHIPNCREIHASCAHHFEATGRLDQAELAVQTLISYDPVDLQAQYRLASLRYQQKNVEGACGVWESIWSGDDSQLRAATKLMTGRRQICDWRNHDDLHNRIRQESEVAIQMRRPSHEEPAVNVSFFADLKYNRRVADSWTNHLFESSRTTRPVRLSQQPDRIHVAFLSDEFRDHAVGHMCKDLFSKWNRSRFRVSVYFDHAQASSDPVYRCIRDSCDQWLHVANLSHEELAQRIRSDEVHVLVDLKGWRDNNRMPVLALRPSPVCVQFFGFPGTSGTPFIDYLIADRVVASPEEQEHYSEALAFVNGCYFATPDSWPDFLELNTQCGNRSEHGLPQDGIVFSSFNQAYKLDPHTFRAWMRILDACPKSVLWLLELNSSARRNLRRFALAEGIDPSRLVFAPWASQIEHLARSTHADIALDTLVYNGHTTTADMLWANVPVISVLGKHFASRVSASMLRSVGLDELVVSNLEKYCQLAINLAHDSQRRSAMRSKLTTVRLRQSLFDTQSLVRDLEDLLGQMVDRNVKGLAPTSISVSS